MRFLARRLVILASEDVGNADPQALLVAVAAMQACEFVGLPECQLSLAQAVTYLACAPKSNASTVAIGEALADVREGRLLPVPVHLRDRHYPGAERLGHGEGYEYAHDHDDAVAAQDYLGVEREYYRPVDRGFERELAARLEDDPPAPAGRESIGKGPDHAMARRSDVHDGEVRGSDSRRPAVRQEPHVGLAADTGRASDKPRVSLRLLRVCRAAVARRLFPGLDS